MITCRRYYLDEFLDKLSSDFSGHVLDIGGKRDNKRGTFRPPTGQVDSWKFLNTDEGTNPDYHCSACEIPLPDQSVDWFLLTEVLEHLTDPYTALDEAARILKPGGKGIITMPFLNQVHADPDDYQRWTRSKFERELSLRDFDIVDFQPSGGVVAVIYDLIRAHLYRSPKLGSFCSRVCLKLLQLLGRPSLWLDRRLRHSDNNITTGWSALVQKRET